MIISVLYYILWSTFNAVLLHSFHYWHNIITCVGGYEGLIEH